MNTAAFVSQLIVELYPQGIPLSNKAWQIALACEDWAYVYSAWGAECTPSERKKRYGYTANENIVKNCQVLSGKKGSCDGCKWYPDRFRTRCFDCRGFTKWVIEQATGFALYGDTVSTQWGTEDNWCEKGQIGKDEIPQGVLVNLFIYKGGKWTHTGLYYNGATCECSSNVQHFEKMKANRWTHWAVAKPFKGEMKEANKVPEGFAKVTGKRVALRKEPSTKAGIIMRIDTGNLVKLEPEPPKEWDYVEYNGKRGYMMREFLQEG